MQTTCSLVSFIGRICISAIFILAGFQKLISYEATAIYMASKGMTMIPLFLYAAAFIEILGGLGILFGYKTRYAALILALFLIPTTIIFHDFWNVAANEKELQTIHFFANLAIFGGLLQLISWGAGACSFDNLCCKNNQAPQK